MSLKWSLLVLLALAPACGAFSPKGPSDVARGEYYAAGRPEYDRFFIALHEKQVELLTAPNEPQDTRKSLTASVDLTPDASDDALKQRLAEELKELAAQGLRVRLEVPAPSTTLDASATLHASEGSVSTPLRTTLPQEATRLVRSRNRMLATQAELEKLRVVGITLEGSVDTQFRTDGPWKRDEVRQNLADGQKVITLMQARAQDVAEADTRLLALLGSAVTTDPSVGLSAPEPAPAELEAKKPRRPGPRGGAPARASNAAKPPASPAVPAAKPIKRNDDEAAAPKPVQGNAPAEIEP